MTDQQLFSEIKSIISEHEQNVRLTGENFNIFEVLGIETNEVRHSAFLAELLNVQGSHAQRNKYLDLFIEQLKLGDLNFDKESARIFVEYHIGEINDENKTGGNIDILIRDKENNCIIIENKIYAPDQPYQLRRYHNFLLEHKNGKLLYLNLFGKKPSPESFDNLKEGEDYFIITYQSDILPWLKRCMEESENIPTMREIIQQYIKVIHLLTNQLRPMDKELVKLITNSSENMEVAHKIVACFDSVKQKILRDFWQALCCSLENKKQLVEQINNEELIAKYYKAKRKEEEKIIRLWIKLSEKNGYHLCWGAAIEWNFYTGFFIYDSNDKILKGKDINEINEIVKHLKDKKYTTTDTDWLGWKYSNRSLNFMELDSSEIFKLANTDELKSIVNNIVHEALEDIDAIKKIWNKK